MNGIDSLKGRIIILSEAKLDYSPGEIKKFLIMWEEGWPIGEIAEKLWITNYEVALLVIHCELEELISPREGGLRGTLKRTRRRKKEQTQ